MHRTIACLFILLITAHTDGAGLLAPTDQTLPPLRVTDHLVDVSVTDGIAITTVEQTFRNETDRRLEATYVFPLPEHADLTDFQMSFNGKMARGRVLPAAEAAAIYESIVRQSRDPGLIEFIGHRLLQMRVFPIEPRSDTRIQVRYQQVCRPMGDMTAFHYPLRTRKTAGQAYGTVRFTVALSTAAPLKSIWSPTHAVEIVRDGEHAARIAYEATRASLEEDFLLLYDTDSSELGLSAVAHQPDPAGPGHFVLMLTPRQLWPETSYQPQDVVFVLDTSGSMAGDKIRQAKSALQFCVNKLDERDRFSVVRFSTGFDVLFDRPLAATAENRARAGQWIERFTAAGGTNIADTLDHVLGPMRPRAGDDHDARPFVVIFLTDGRGNRDPEAIIRQLGASTPGRTDVRIFPFGVGHDVNTVLLDRLADRFTGRPTYVQPGENLELVLSDFFSIISRPVLTALRLSLPDVGVTEQFPAVLGDLYHGQQLIVAGRLATPGRGRVKLTAMRNGVPVEYVWPEVDFTSTAEATAVPSLWAGRKIAYLVDQIRRHGESDEMVAEIIALSQAHGIQTPYTSWLVDPEREAQLARVRPIAAPMGGGGGSGGGRAGAAPAPGRNRQLRRLLELDGAGNIAVTDAALGEAAGQDLHLFDLDEAEAGLERSAGRVASLIARSNEALKTTGSRDLGRISASLLLNRTIGDRRYNRIGDYLVDARFDEKTEVTVVRFASPAYFRLVHACPWLRPAFGASSQVVVLVGEGQAVLVSRTEGLDEFTPEQWEQLRVQEDWSN